MGITYHISASHGLIYSRIKGDISPQALREHCAQVRRDPAFHRGLREIAVVGGIRAFPHSQELFSIASWLGTLEPFGGIALVCLDDLSFGLARMFETLMNESHLRVQAFRTMEAALRWLDVPGRQAGQ